tara:strand:- start:43 stop:1011 length:969 start_codon:yes stop_codon:yes gene_type:complete
MSIQSSENGFTRISTQGQRTDHRFEFWRSLFPRIDIDVLHKEGRQNFKADLLRYSAPGLCDFGYGVNDDTIARFAKPESEFVMLSLPLSGAVHMRMGTGTTCSVKAGEGLIVVDSMQPMTSASESHSHLCLTIPRARATAVMGDDLAALGRGVRVLPLTGLPALLASHLQMMASCSEALDAPAAVIAMQSGVDMALGALTQMGGTETAIQDGLHLDAVHAAASRYIQLNFRAQGLTALTVAQAVGCSRAHLYRAFDVRNHSVGDMIRDTRLDYAAGLLTSSPYLTVDQIAHQCGYGGGSALARVFRKYRGITASEYRSRYRR